MSGLTPDKLRQAANIKRTITTPTAEGVKGTTVEIAKGAAKGAATGGWVGAAKGAAVSFAKTKAGRRVIAGLAVCSLATGLAVPVGAVISMHAATQAIAYGTGFLAGESAVGSGKEREEVSAAMSLARKHGLQWSVYLALTTVEREEDIDIERLASILNRTETRTLGAGGVLVEGQGLTAGQSDAEKQLASEERKHYVESLQEYGLAPSEAEKVYNIALKWAFGQQETCTAKENVKEDGDDTSDIVTSDGKTYSLSEVQTSNAAQIIQYASKIPGMTGDAVLISLMAAMTESSLKNYANKNVPESLDYPHDAVGEDHDSVGFWQMRKHWGTTEELMNIEYQVAAFFGGPDGPNGGSPRGLFDIPGWEQMTKGEAAQAVEVSAHPDRYDAFETLAVALLERYGQGITFCDGGLGFGGAAGHPLGDPTHHVITSPFGYRKGVPGADNHYGLDFRAACFDSIYAIADGTVLRSGPELDWGNAVVIDHGGDLVTRSAHMPDGGDWVKAGTKVKIGDRIGSVGNTGKSFGCHLHLETLIGGKRHNPATILTDLGVELHYAG